MFLVTAIACSPPYTRHIATIKCGCDKREESSCWCCIKRKSSLKNRMKMHTWPQGLAALANQTLPHVIAHKQERASYILFSLFFFHFHNQQPQPAGNLTETLPNGENQASRERRRTFTTTSYPPPRIASTDLKRATSNSLSIACTSQYGAFVFPLYICLTVHQRRSLRAE